MRYDEMVLYDVDKVDAILKILEDEKFDAGCVYGVFYGLYYTDDVKVRWHMQLTPEQVNQQTAQSSADAILNRFRHELKIHRVNKE